VPVKSPSKPLVLCIDDEPSILKSIERCFAGEGYVVLKAESGLEGLSMLEERGGKVDLIIVDQRMPQMSGEAFLKIARQKYGHLTVIMLSGYADFESLVSAVKKGEISRFIAKPWSNQELVETVRSVLRQSNRSIQKDEPSI
jgi:DNA-binding NtrC family response regulator